jgi:two-component sensor histidine kinase
MLADLSKASAASSQPLALHLVEEISHRVVNEYAEAIAILTLAASRRSATADSALTQAAERLRAHAESHRALLAPRADGPFDLGHHIAKLCWSLSGASLEDRGIQLRLSTEEIWIDSARGWRLCLIVAELVRNAVRHGLQGRPGVIDVDVKNAGLRIQCIVTDDGRAEADPVEGRGRRFVRALAAELQGSVNWSFTNSGSTVNVEFPIVEPTDFPDPAPDRF